MIKFQKPYDLDKSLEYIRDTFHEEHIDGDGKYTKLCQEWINNELKVKHTFMMNSCTSAIECALRVLDIGKDDEVILPSFTHPSTANAVVLTGARPVFTQVQKINMNLDPDRLEEKITDQTRAVIVVHYGGVSCDMDPILAICKRHDIKVIEDAAQSFLSTYKGSYTGTIGDFGCFSFHGTKDIVAGEAGALLVNHPDYVEKTEIFRQKGTNRDSFVRGDSEFYEWVGPGSSFSPSEVNMAILLSQLERSDEIIEKKRKVYNYYKRHITRIIESSHSSIRLYCTSADASASNAHLFYLIFQDHVDAKYFVEFMKRHDVDVRTHFVPLHESEMGKQFCTDPLAFEHEKEIGQRLVRLPLYADLEHVDYYKVVVVVKDYLL